MTTFPNRASKETVELAPVFLHRKTRTWAGKCLPILLVVIKVGTAVILDPLVGSHKEAMQRQLYGMTISSEPQHSLQWIER